MNNGHGLSKKERLCSRKAIDALFAGAGSMSLSVYPIRAIFKHTEEAETRVLVSVSKKRFRHAVDRNRVKRQLREQYRLHKDMLDCPDNTCNGMDIAFIWLTDRLQPSSLVQERMVALLGKIAQADRAKTRTTPNKTPAPPKEGQARPNPGDGDAGTGNTQQP